MEKDILSNEDYDILDKIELKLMDTAVVDIKAISVCLKNVVEKEEQRIDDNKGLGSGYKIKFDVRRFNYEIAQAFLDNMPIKTITDNEEVYIYDEETGVWKDGGEHIIAGLCQEHLEKYGATNTIKEVLGIIKRTTFVERDKFNNDATKIVLRNGVLDLETLQVYPHSKDYLYTIALPVRYDPDAECPEFMKLINEKMIDDDDRKTLQQYFGFCLLNDMRFQKALLLYGCRRAGKSTVLHVLNKIIGYDNTTNMTLHYLNNNNFALAYLFGMKANICADLPTEALRSISKFMLITGEDGITADKKGKHPITFMNIAKPIFSCNQIPRIPVQEPAFYRRWIVLNFPYETSIVDVDPNLKNKLSTDAELSGVLNWMIAGAKEILKNEKIYYNKTDDDVTEIWRKNSDSIEAFILKHIDIADDERVKKREIYNAYMKYCSENGLRKENHILFGRVFMGNTGCGTGRINQIPCYVGVKLKEKESVSLKNYDIYTP